MSHDLRWTKWRTSTRRSIRLTSEHSAHLGSFRSVHLPVIRLTSEVSVPCTRHEVGYSSEVCRMHAGQAADTSDLPIQSRPWNRYFSVSVCLSLMLKWTPSWNLASTNLLWKSILANALWTISGAIILSGAPEGLITEPPFLHTRTVISLHQRWPRVSARNGNGRGEPNGCKIDFGPLDWVWTYSSEEKQVRVRPPLRDPQYHRNSVNVCL